jgi:hypothetical protein
LSAVTIKRGYYGPQPLGAIGAPAHARSRRTALLAGRIGRHLAAVRGLRGISASERQVLADVVAQARFRAWAPDRVPAGFFVRGADVASYSRDVVTFALSDGGRRSFEIAQRVRWMPLLDELNAAGVPFDRVAGISPPLYLVHGKYGGEPIDRSFWSTRRGLHFECGDLSVEFREVIGTGPGLWALVHFATSSRPDRRPA